MKTIYLIFILLFVAMFLVQRYCQKKNLNITLTIIIILVTFYCVVLSIDMNRINSFRKPIFMWETQNNCGALCNSYQGLGYRAHIEYYNNGIIEEITLTMFNKVIAGGIQDIVEIPTKNFTIIDETINCDSALETIYEDEYFIYSFPCIKSDTVFIVSTDGSKISVKEAIKDSTMNWGELITIKYPEMFHILAKETDNIDSCNVKDFEMSLYSDKKVYKTDESIKIWTTLKYIGNKDKITIWHAGSANSDTYFNYFITDGKDFNLHSVTNSMLKSTILDKNVLYYYNYQKSGGWDVDGSDANFWENFFNEKKLYLPIGEYTITASSGFGLSDSPQDIGLKCNLTFKVI